MVMVFFSRGITEMGNLVELRRNRWTRK